jgi:hypothetical protein
VKLRIAAAVVVVVALGVAAWALVEKHQTERVVLSMLYLDTTTHIKNDLYILTSLREGRQTDAIAYLEMLLDHKVTILEGCKYDICAHSTPTQYAEAIRSVAEYKKRYQVK